MTPMMCLAMAIYFEARSEPIDGQFAVADVIITRVEDSRYPNSICEVVYEDSAFSWTLDEDIGNPVGEPWEIAQEIAKASMEYDTRFVTATHYHTTNISPFWASSYDVVGVIGNHIFYMNNTPYK